MRPADGIPRFLLPSLSRILFRPRPDDVEEWTELSRDQWRQLAKRFPALGEDPGPEAAAARRRLAFLAGRALSTDRHGPRWEGESPDPKPTVYLSAHLGDLRTIRYLLRGRGIPAAHVVGPENFERAQIEDEDRDFDRKSLIGFPHVFYTNQPRRLVRALATGSLLIAVDRPAAQTFSAPFLGGTLDLDPRPLRIARIAGVPARGIFLTAPEGRLTMTVGPILPSGDDSAALGVLGALLATVAGRVPYEFDLFTHR